MSKTMILLAAAVVLAVGLSVGVSVVLLGHRSPALATAAESHARAPDLNVEVPPLNLDTFTTNLADSDKHYIQVTFILLPKDAKTGEQLNGAKPLLRDAVLTILRTRTMADVRGAEGKASLAAAVQARLDELAGKGAVQRVLVTDLVVQ